MSKWGANIVNCIWINWNHWAKYLKASITKEWNGWTHALFEIFAFATNGDGGDSGSVSSNDNGGIDDPNVCEKLHELVLTSTEKSGFHAYPYTQRRRRRRKERFSFYDCRTQMQQSVLMCVLSKANVDITQEWQAHKTYTHTHICTEKERKRIRKERDIGVLMLLREMILCANSYLSNTEYFGRRHYASLNVLPCSWIMMLMLVVMLAQDTATAAAHTWSPSDRTQHSIPNTNTCTLTSMEKKHQGVRIWMYACLWLIFHSKSHVYVCEWTLCAMNNVKDNERALNVKCTWVSAIILSWYADTMWMKSRLCVHLRQYLGVSLCVWGRKCEFQFCRRTYESQQKYQGAAEWAIWAISLALHMCAMEMRASSETREQPSARNSIKWRGKELQRDEVRCGMSIQCGFREKTRAKERHGHAEKSSRSVASSGWQSACVTTAIRNTPHSRFSQFDNTWCSDNTVFVSLVPFLCVFLYVYIYNSITPLLLLLHTVIYMYTHGVCLNRIVFFFSVVLYII